MLGQPELLADCVQGRGHLGEAAGGALALGQPRVTNLRQECGHESHDVSSECHLDDRDVPVGLRLHHLLLTHLVVIV